MGCKFKNSCNFHLDKIADMPATSSVFKKMYCEGIADNCARFMVIKRLGKDDISGSMMPNNRKQAIEILARQSGH